MSNKHIDLHLAIRHLEKDPLLGSWIPRIEVPDFTPRKNVYFDLLESIVSQQLSVKAADTIYNRLLDLFPDKYPNPQLLLTITPERLRAVGLSQQKTQYILNVAKFTLENDLEQVNWNNFEDSEIILFLSQIKGVGTWTVQMVLMFTLGRPDVFPVDDLGIQKGMIALAGLEERGKDLKLRMQELAEPWRPWRTVACRLLWKIIAMR